MTRPGGGTHLARGAYIDRAHDLEPNETVNMVYVRKRLGDKGVQVFRDGTRRQLSSETIRVRMRVATIASELQHRRVQR